MAPGSGWLVADTAGAILGLLRLCDLFAWLLPKKLNTLPNIQQVFSDLGQVISTSALLELVAASTTAYAERVFDSKQTGASVTQHEQTQVFE